MNFLMSWCITFVSILDSKQIFGKLSSKAVQFAPCQLSCLLGSKTVTESPNKAVLSFTILWIETIALWSLCLSLSLDIDECKSGRNTCANDTVCFNLDGGYDCRCPHGHNCTGDCIYDSKVKHNGQIWVLDNDRCSVCSCQVSKELRIWHTLKQHW